MSVMKIEFSRGGTFYARLLEAEAPNAGVSPAIVRKVLAGFEREPDVVGLATSQTEHERTVGQYLTLLVTAELPPAADVDPVSGVSSGEAMSARSRGKNIQLAQADRQAVFKGDCAACHSDYAEAQFGHDLYLGACAICHDAEQRASMVPDLREAGVQRDAAHWRQHITDGIDGTLMPAFAIEKGGILSDEQIESLVKFLVETPL